MARRRGDGSLACTAARRKANAVFVLSELGEPARILRYYTLCAMALSQGDVPEAARRHIPRYPLVSATLIGRLAVAKDRQGRGLGWDFLADALQRSFDSAATVGSSMVVIDALDEPAAGFYAAHGFVRLPELMLGHNVIQAHRCLEDRDGNQMGLLVTTFRARDLAVGAQCVELFLRGPEIGPECFRGVDRSKN